MGGRFAAFGVGVVDMVVEGELVELLGHLQQVVFGQLDPHQARIAGGDHAEIVGQLQLAQFVVAAAQQILHDLQQDPGGIDLVEGGGGEKDLVAQRTQGLDPVTGFALFQGTEQAGDGIGDAQAPGRRHLLNAVGMHMFNQQGAQRPGVVVAADQTSLTMRRSS